MDTLTKTTALLKFTELRDLYNYKDLIAGKNLGDVRWLDDGEARNLGLVFSKPSYFSPNTYELYITGAAADVTTVQRLTGNLPH